VSDIIDRAAEREQQFLQDALARHARAAAARGVGDVLASAQFCGEFLPGPVGCGEPIPAARRRALAGVQLCVECQALHERALRRQA